MTRILFVMNAAAAQSMHAPLLNLFTCRFKISFPEARIKGLVLDQLDEVLQLLFTDFRNSEVIHAGFGPAQDVVAILAIQPTVKRFRGGRPDEEIDEVFPALINNGCNIAMV